MTTPTYKMLLFLKRRPGLSTAEFRDYYETTHAKLCETYTSGVTRYVRRYVDPVGATPEDLGFDVITEIWMEDEAALRRIAEWTSRGEPPPDILADEEKLFDRAKSRVALVVEHDSAPDDIR